MTLTFFVLLAMYGFTKSWLEAKDWGSILFFVAAAVGTLAKGLPALLPPLLSVVAFLAVTGHSGSLRRLRIGRGLILYVALMLCWLVPAGLAAGLDYPRSLLVDQSLNRYVAASGHIRPWYYYFFPLIMHSLPFTALLPATWMAASDDERVERYLFPVFWVVVTTLFFSLSSGKRTVYVIALTAPIALLVAGGLARLGGASRTARRMAVAGFAVPFLLFALVAIAALGGALEDQGIDRLGTNFHAQVQWLSLIPATGLAIALALSLARRYIAAAVCAGSAFAATTVAFSLLLFPGLDTVKSARSLAELMAETIPVDEPYAIYPLPDAGFLFYSGRYSTPIWGEDDLRSFVSQPGRRWLVIERDDLEALDPPLAMEEVARDADWVEGHVLLRTP